VLDLCVIRTSGQSLRDADGRQQCLQPRLDYFSRPTRTKSADINSSKEHPSLNDRKRAEG